MSDFRKAERENTTKPFAEIMRVMYSPSLEANYKSHPTFAASKDLYDKCIKNATAYAHIALKKIEEEKPEIIEESGKNFR